MLRESSVVELELAAGEAVSLLRTAGWSIVCVSGRIWLTEEGGGEDVWLAAGQRYHLTRPGRTVVEATGAVSLRMCRAGADRPLPRVIAACRRAAAALPVLGATAN